MTLTDFRTQANALRDELIAMRRDLHRHPELAFEEVRTAGIVAQQLNELGLEVQTGIGKTGVVGLLEGRFDGPTVLVRADMDALPIHEENETSYASTVPGKMHACGHDGHTSIAIGVAKLLAGCRNQMRGRVKFVFQPAEEIVGGAKAMIADGVLEGPRPDVSLGLHLWNSMPLGKLGVADGPVMAGSSRFKITVLGKGGHGAAPHHAADPVLCAAHLITALQSIVSRNVNPMEDAVVSTTMMRAGDADNIIPQQVELRGTFRAFKIEVRDLISRRIEEIAKPLCAAFECLAVIDIEHGTIPTVNDSRIAERVRGVLKMVVGEDRLDLTVRTMGSEDMAYLMEDIPGMYFFVGSANEARGLNYAHHHPRFDFDEDALPLSVELMARAVAEFVLPG